MTSVNLPDPVIYDDRACNGVPQNIFFPVGKRPTAVRMAREICGRCPRLVECAAFSAPLVRTGALSGCVVASVQIPAEHSSARQQRLRMEAVDQLVAIAARDTRPQGEGAVA